jgi:hypothetical protein
VKTGKTITQIYLLDLIDHAIKSSLRQSYVNGLRKGRQKRGLTQKVRQTPPELQLQVDKGGFHCLIIQIMRNLLFSLVQPNRVGFPVKI